MPHTGMEIYCRYSHYWKIHIILWRFAKCFLTLVIYFINVGGMKMNDSLGTKQTKVSANSNTHDHDLVLLGYSNVFWLYKDRNIIYEKMYCSS